MTQKNSLTSFEMNLENEFPRDGFGRIAGHGFNQRTTLSLELEITPETRDRVSLAISKALDTPRTGFCTLRLDLPATNQVALDGILDALQGGKVEMLKAEVKDLQVASIRHAGEKAKLEARVLELEKAS